MTSSPDASARSAGSDLADRYVGRASQALEGGDPSAALFLAETAVDLDPERLAPRLIAASACRHLGRLDQAAEHLDHAVRLAPDQAGVRAMAGLVAYRRNEFTAARPHLTRALELDPDQVAVRSALALVADSEGDRGSARKLLLQGLERCGEHPDLLCNLATLASRDGDWHGARALLERALQEAPDHVESLVNLALAQDPEADGTQGSARALEILQRAARVAPDRVEVLAALGGALRHAKALVDSLATLQRALDLAPDSPQVHNNLGLTHLDLGEPDEAERHLRRALALVDEESTQHALVSCNLGILLTRSGRLDESIEVLREAKRVAPDSHVAAGNLANSLLQAGRRDEAEAIFRDLIERFPEQGLAHMGLGNLAVDTNRYSQALHHARTALDVAPGSANALNLLGITLQNLGQPAEGSARCRQAAARAGAPADRQDYLSNAVYFWQFLGGVGPEKVLAAHRAVAPVFETGRPDPARPHANPPDPERRLRVGYFSGDFRAHSVAFFLQGVLAGHDRGAVEVVAYSATAKPDGVTRRLKDHCDLWRDVRGMGTRQVADLVARDGIDIAVDLAGHTAYNLLPALALRPAPVTISWLGYPGTTGLSAIDWRLSDDRADPPDDPWSGPEKVLRLPHCFHLYTPAPDVQKVAPAPGLIRRGVTFCSFNNLSKVTDQVVAAWGRILAALPEARLLMKCKQFKDPELVARTVERLVAAGAARHQVEPITYAANLDEHMAIYGFADLGLDTFPYNGTTTTCEAMWMGVPVLSLAGDRHAGRVGASLLHAVGLAGDLLARDVEDYVARAIALGRDPRRLAEWRAGLRQRLAASPLCDRAGFVADLEAAYRAAWRDWCARVTAEGPTHCWLAPDPTARPDWPDFVGESG